MGLALVDELQTVLDGPQPHVRIVELLGIGRAHVSARRELFQRVERAARAYRHVVASVHELQQLDRELDIAYPAIAAFDLARRHALAFQHALGARLHRTNIANRVGIEHVRPHITGRARDELLAERRIAGDGPRLHERLEFPRLHPLPPVRLVRGKRPAERTGSSFGSKVRISPEDDAVRTRRAHRAQHRARNVLGDLLVAVVHEQDVDIARIVELVSAELAHADHGERNRRRGVRDRDVETRLRQAGKLASRRAQVGAAEQITRGDADDVLALPPAQGARRILSPQQLTRFAHVRVDGHRCFERVGAQHGDGDGIAFQRGEERTRRRRHGDDRVQQDFVARKSLSQPGVGVDEARQR